MALTDWANISVIAQSIFIPISVVLILYQLHKQTKLTQASNAQALVEIYSPFNLLLIQNRDVVELWRTGASRYDELDDADKARFEYLLIWWLLLHENIYHQNQMRLIDRKIYESWQRDLIQFVCSKKLDRSWPGLREFFHADFSRHVDQLMGAK